jgi:sec-independent protein translocase protein TatA
VLTMGNIGAPELLIILGVLVLIFGASQLPKLARSIGQAQKEFKAGLKEGASEDGDEDKPSKGKSSK